MATRIARRLVSLEWQFYLVAPMVVAAIARRSLLLLLIAATLALMWVPNMSGAFLGNKSMFFAVGIFSYIYTRDRMRASRRIWALTAILLTSSVLLVQDQDGVIPLAIWGIVFASTLGYCNSALIMLNRVLSARPLVYLGARSYSAYLVHMIPLYLSVYALNELNLSPLGYGVSLLGLTLVFTLAISSVTFFVIEKPGIRLGTRLAGRVPYQGLRALQAGVEKS